MGVCNDVTLDLGCDNGTLEWDVGVDHEGGFRKW